MRRKKLVQFVAVAAIALIALGVESVWPRSAVGPSPHAGEPTAPEEAPGPEIPEAPAVVAVDAEAARAIAAETASGRWDREAIPWIRPLLRGRSRRSAKDVLVLAGLEGASAGILAGAFRGSDAYFDYRIGDRKLLIPTFERDAAGRWGLTLEFLATFVLPFHPKLPAPLAPPPSLDAVKGKYERCEAIGRHRYESTIFSESLRCTLGFRSHPFHVTTSTELLRDDWSFADRIDHALSNIPDAHLRLVPEIIIDPGEHPKGHNATTSWDGTEVNMFLAGAGKDVKQENLDRTTAHEFGHVLSGHQDDRFWWRWSAAITADKLGVSAYGMTNMHEDFAETYVLYLGGGRTDVQARKSYPARFALMDTLFPPNG